MLVMVHLNSSPANSDKLLLTIVENNSCEEQSERQTQLVQLIETIKEKFHNELETTTIDITTQGERVYNLRETKQGLSIQMSANSKVDTPIAVELVYQEFEEYSVEVDDDTGYKKYFAFISEEIQEALTLFKANVMFKVKLQSLS